MAERFNRRMLAEVFKEPRLLRDFEEFSKTVDQGLPELVSTAQSTADSASAAAIAAQGTANSAVSAAATAQSTANAALAKRFAATIAINSFSYFEANTSGYIISLCSAAGGPISVNLTSCSACAGMIICIKKTDASPNTVTAVPFGLQTIDGLTSRVLSTQYANITIVSDGTSWNVIT